MQRIWRAGIAAAVLMAPLLTGCKPPAFAAHEGELLHEPPPVLTEQNGFWNDPATSSFGEISFAPGVYRNGPLLCRPARQTIVNSFTHLNSDTTLLYCQSPVGDWRWQRAVVCRQARVAAGLTCRDASGSDFEMSPV